MSKQRRGAFPRHQIRAGSREFGKPPVLFSPPRYAVAVDGPERLKRQRDRPQIIFPPRVAVARKRKSAGRRREGHDHARRAWPCVAPWPAIEPNLTRIQIDLDNDARSTQPVKFVGKQRERFTPRSPKP